MKATATCPWARVAADGFGVVANVELRLLVYFGDRSSTLSALISAAPGGLRGSRARHDPGRVLIGLAVSIVDGAETISEIAVLAD